MVCGFTYLYRVGYYQSLTSPHKDIYKLYLSKDAVLFLINKYLHRKGNVTRNDVLAKANAIIDCEEHLNQGLG